VALVREGKGRGPLESHSAIGHSNKRGGGGERRKEKAQSAKAKRQDDLLANLWQLAKAVIKAQQGRRQRRNFASFLWKVAYSDNCCTDPSESLLRYLDLSF
jgi:hypothetical protein